MLKLILELCKAFNDLLAFRRLFGIGLFKCSTGYIINCSGLRTLVASGIGWMFVTDNNDGPSIPSRDICKGTLVGSFVGC